MSERDPLCHCATAEVLAPAEMAFAFMSDGLAIGRWALGSFNTQAEDNGLFSGVSLFDGERGFIQIDADPARRVIDYHIGTRARRLPRITARIVPGANIDRDAATCLVTMTAWRGQGMDDARWNRLCITHEAEILLVKAMIEGEAQKKKSNA